MKQRTLLLVAILFVGILTKAQPTPEVQATIDACLALRAAIGAGSNEGLKQANKALKACDVQPFNKLRCREEQPPSLNGHFVFETEFVDSLIQNRKVYKFAQQYADRSVKRATSSSGKVFAKTCMVKGKKSITYTLVAKGTQYIAVVTEPKGLVTLRIHDKTNDKWYNDTDDVNTGRPSRIQTLDLPKDKNSLLEIEIINTSKKDISFVIIGN
jgi:hypothetical protein